MEDSQNIDFKGISLHMKKEMSRIRMLRIVFRILTSIVYLCTVVWFGFCIFGGFLVDRTDQGAEWFHRLRTNPPALLDECCRRDMMIFEG